MTRKVNMRLGRLTILLLAGVAISSAAVSANAQPAQQTALVARQSLPLTEMVRFVPYEAKGWKFKQVAHGERQGFEKLKAPPELIGDFEKGRAAFGTLPSGCPLNGTVHTNWDPDTDMLLRRGVVLPPGTRNVRAWLAIDNNFELYWNGNLVDSGTHDGCPLRNDFVLQVPREFLKDGHNLLAVRAIDVGLEAFIDLKITGTVPG